MKHEFGGNCELLLFCKGASTPIEYRYLLVIFMIVNDGTIERDEQSQTNRTPETWIRLDKRCFPVRILNCNLENGER